MVIYVDEYVGIAIGGTIGFLSAFLSAFLIDYFRSRRELKKWKLESAHEFFRRNYDSLAPFFGAPYKILFATAGALAQEISNLPKEKQEQITYNLEKVVHEISEALGNFVNRGYIGLFPKDLGAMMLLFDIKLARLNQLVKEKGILDKETTKTLDEVMSTGDKIQGKMRQLLNVDALG
jgi:gas vesicle protein